MVNYKAVFEILSDISVFQNIVLKIGVLLLLLYDSISVCQICKHLIYIK